MRARDTFGGRLKSERERVGISLDAIAKSTKIKRSLLAELENNDLSHWPTGIFRRAFFREYLAAIGYSSDAVMAEFARLFPDSGTAPEEARGELRLKLAAIPSSATHRLLAQSASAAADFSVVTFLALAAVTFLPFQSWKVVAILVAAYYGLSGALLGRAPVAAWLARERRVRVRPKTADAVRQSVAAEPALLRIVVRHAELPRERLIADHDSEAPAAPEAVASPSSTRRQVATLR